MKKTVLFAMILLNMAACQSTVSSPTTPSTMKTTVQPSDLKKQWQLTQLASFTAQQLNQTEMNWRNLPQASANMGCNNLNFNVDLQNNGSLKVGSVASTRMYCADTMPIEHAFSTQITQMTHYYVDKNGNLVLHNNAGTEMRFVEKTKP